MHYGLFLLHLSRTQQQPAPPPRRSGGRRPRRRTRLSARWAAALTVVLLCLAGATYAVASDASEPASLSSGAATSQPAGGDDASDLPSRPGRLGASH